MNISQLRPAHLLLTLLFILVGEAALQPPPGFHLSLSPLSAHLFTTLADVFRFIEQLDCRKDPGE